MTIYGHFKTKPVRLSFSPTTAKRILERLGIQTSSSFVKICIPNFKADFLYITMIGNGKFEPFTVWNDIELRYRITASQWAF